MIAPSLPRWQNSGFAYQGTSYRTPTGQLIIVHRPFVPVHLFANEKRSPVPVYALLDSGCDRVIFPADLSALVGIVDFRSGQQAKAIGVSGQPQDVFEHQLALRIVGDTRLLPLAVGFSNEVPLPLLGRSFFAQFKVIMFKESEREVELIF